MAEAKTVMLSNGYQLRYRRYGSGPTIIFMHGYPETHAVFINLMSKLADQYEVLAFDWPGMGGSEVWKGGSTPKSMGDRIAEIMKCLSIDQAHLVAHDMGAQASLLCAAEHPEKVLSVCVSNSLLIHDAETSWEIKYLRNLRLNKFVLTYLPRVVFARAMGTFKSGRLNASLKNEFWTYFKKKEVREYIIRMCFGYQAQLPRLPQYYSKIDCPVLAIWSQENKHFSLDHAQKLQKLVKHTKIEMLEGGVHWIAHENPDEMARILRVFLSKLA